MEEIKKVKIKELPSAENVSDSDIFIGSDGLNTYKITVEQIAKFISEHSFLLSKFILKNTIGVADGVPPLNENSKIDGSYITYGTTSNTAYEGSSGKILEENKADINSPIFTGIPEAPTAPEGNNTTQLATTAFVYTAIYNKIAELIDGAPEAMDTLKELSDAISAHHDVTDLLNTAIGNKVDKISGKGLSTNDLTTELKENYNAAYTHSNEDEKHIPVSTTGDNGKYLKASSSPGVYEWGELSKNDIINVLGYTPGSSDGNGGYYGTCSSDAETATKTVACDGFTLQTGNEVTVKFMVTNTANNPCLNVNDTGEIPIYYRNSPISKNYLLENCTYKLIYNGTQWELIGDINTDTKNTAGSTNNTSKLFLVGTKSQAINPQTYSRNTAYVGTDGCLYSNSTRVVSEVVQTSEPPRQKSGDYWLYDY